MSLPGNRLPEHDTPKAQIWDGLAVSWTWSEERQLYLCDDPGYSGEPITEPGALPEERQPVYAHPPNAAQRAAREINEGS